jgi:hypothetical protein
MGEGGGDMSPSWTNQKNLGDMYRLAAREVCCVCRGKILMSEIFF